jgi:hypothetical protein
MLVALSARWADVGCMQSAGPTQLQVQALDGGVQDPFSGSVGFRII